MGDGRQAVALSCLQGRFAERTSPVRRVVMQF
jgi:hypothetical protein